jgi:TetR/AcrR family transcriptional repressor of nem operon
MPTAHQLIMSEANLDKMIFLFWDKGYVETSIHDLVAITGYNRAALYKHFGGKEGLFHLMLQRFRGKVVVDATSTLSNPHAGIDGIKRFFLQFIECTRETNTAPGCYMMAVAANLPMHEPEAARVIEEFINHLRALFYKNLRWQQAEKHLDSELNTDMTADFLVGNVLGLMTLLRSAAEPRMLQNHVKLIVAYISALPLRKSPGQGNLHLIT